MFHTFVVALFIVSSVSASNPAPPPRVALIEKAEVVGTLDGSEFRVVVHASGVPYTQSVKELKLWIDGRNVPIPKEAYVGAWSLNPGSIEIWSGKGIVGHRLPEDVRSPLVSLRINGYGPNWAVVILLERHVPVASLVRTHNGIQCHAFDERYEVTCRETQAQGTNENVDAAHQEPEI